MNGIDISKWQKGINLAAVPCDFVIVKATQGVNYTSPEFRTQISQAQALGKLIGVYHYANGAGVDIEANHFVEVIKPYIGQVILAIDWENNKDKNGNNDNPQFAAGNYKYCEQLLTAVKEKTGITPFLYMSKSVCRQYKWEVGRNFPLWCAQYKKTPPTTYTDNPWTDSKGFGAWAECAILQYSSKGRLEGYNHNLDLDKAYINEAQWIAYAQDDIKPVESSARPTLKKGDKNDYVKAWQTLLYSAGYKEVGAIDGAYGEKTEKAVMHYQQDHGMESGIIGEATWATIQPR